MADGHSFADHLRRVLGDLSSHDPDAEIARLRQLVIEHIRSWQAYFAASGGKPEELWPTFKALVDAMEAQKEPRVDC